MPDQPEQSPVTTRTGLSVDEAAARLAAATKSAAQSEATEQSAEANAAPTSEQQPDGLDPEGTNLEAEESDAGGSADDDAEQATAGDDEDADDDAKDPVYRATVNGEEVDVSLSELLASYSRHGDYTQKTQALAEQRRAIESKAKEVDERAGALSVREQRLEQYDAALDALQGVLKTADDEYAKFDWEKLEEEDPVEAQRQWRRYQQHKERKAEAEAEARRRTKEREQEAAQRHQQSVKAFQADIAKHFPHWSDEGVRMKEWKAMHGVATSLGFTDAELVSTTDPRVIRLLHKAMKFDRVEAAKASAASAAPKSPAKQPSKVVQPGGARPAVRAGTSGGVRDAVNKLRKTGSIDAAAEYLRARSVAARSGQARG